MTERSRDWPGDRATAQSYADLRHPALPNVRVEHTAAGPVLSVDPPDSVYAPADTPAALQTAQQLSDALEALHRLGLVHGQVTAANVRTTPAGPVLAGLARPGTTAEQPADREALGRLVRQWVASSPPDVTTPAAPSLTSATAPAPAGVPVASTVAAERDRARRRTRNRLIAVAVAVVAVGAGVLALVDRQGTVTVPREIGRTQQVAVSDLQRAGLTARVLPSQPRRIGPIMTNPPVVDAQSPTPGAHVRPGREVTLTLSAP
jgi:hypothetical protein